MSSGTDFEVPLKFINKLNENEILEFLNNCHESYCEQLEIVFNRIEFLCNDEFMSKKPFRCFETKDYATYYMLSDFGANLYNSLYGSKPRCILDDEWQKFLTIRFGEEYIQVLYNYQMNEAKSLYDSQVDDAINTYAGLKEHLNEHKLKKELIVK